jgi:hypothetical protein
MTKDIGPQYELDDSFRAAARLHQSNYRARILKVDYLEYGNRLNDIDGRALLNYYDGLTVKKTLRERHPKYSQNRDGDLLRSEHIPFNMLAPLADRPDLTQIVIKEAFGLELTGPFEMHIEWAPSPRENYLGDKTSFDTYIQGIDANGERVGIGIEVKYTERGYTIGETEAERVRDRESTYWVTTRESGLFVGGGCDQLAGDDLRQIWRNHLLGLSLVRHKDVARFVSVTLYPKGNTHFSHVLTEYQSHLEATAQRSVCGCTFEKYIACLRGGSEVEAWKQYLIARYLIEDPK